MEEVAESVHSASVFSMRRNESFPGKGQSPTELQVTRRSLMDVCSAKSVLMTVDELIIRKRQPRCKMIMTTRVMHEIGVGLLKAIVEKAFKACRGPHEEANG